MRSPTRSRRPTGSNAHVPSNGTIRPKGRRIDSVSAVTWLGLTATTGIYGALRRLPAPGAPGPPQGRARSGAGPARGNPRRALERRLPAARLRSRALRLAEAVQ